MKVERHPFDSTELVTIGEDEKNYKQHNRRLVRLRPSNTASDEQVKRVKRRLLRAGALAVKVMPRPPGDAMQLSRRAQLVQALAGDSDAIPPLRDLVFVLVDKSTSTRKDKLKQLLGEAADDEGL